MNTMESPARGTVAYVPSLPNCGICPDTEDSPAVVDAKTFQGPWADMCDRHWRTWTAFPSATQDADPELGVGKGQRYVVGEPPTESHEAKVKAISLAVKAGDFDEAFDIVGDGDLMDFL